MPPGGELLRVVVDTNVLFSALAFPADSPPAKVFRLIVDGKVLAFSSPFIMEELENNLQAKTGWDDGQLQVLRRRLKLVMKLVVPTSHLSVIKRIEADNRILECAVDTQANVLITGNLKDIRALGAFRGISILTPCEFLDRHFPKGAISPG